MTGFVFGAAALLAVALLCVLPSLLRRQHPLRGVVATPAHGEGEGGAAIGVLREQLAQVEAAHAAGELDAAAHAAAVADIEQRALDEAVAPAASAPIAAPGDRPPGPPEPPARAAAAVVAVLVCAVAIGLYLRVGNRGALQPPPTAAGVTQEQVEAMVDQLASRLATDPAMANDVQGWVMLGRSAAALQRYAQAQMAFARAIALAPNDAQLLADQADVTAMTQGRRLAGEPMRLIERALQLDPTNLKALAMAGSEAFDRGDYAEAIRRWTAARRTADSGSELANGLERSIAEAERAASGAAGAPGDTARSTAAPAEPASAPNGLRRVVGRISVAASVAGRVAADDTVFVYARAAEGPRMPLAIVRRPASALPFDFVLDDSTAMSPAMKLSTGGAVVVGARISHSGDALPRPGDLQAAPRAVPAGGAERRLDLTVDAVVP